MIFRTTIDKRKELCSFVLYLVVLFFGFPVLSPSPAHAEGNIHAGRLRIHPFLSVSETFSDNIYFTSTEQQRDSFVTYTPGVRLEFPFGEHIAEAQYFAVANRYRVNEGENTTDHTASGLVNFKFGRLFEAGLSDVFLKGHEPRSSSATGFVETFRTNAASASAIYHLANRSRIEFDFGKTVWDFLQSPFRNRDEDLLSAYLYYRFLPKTSAFVEFDRKKAAYEFSNRNGSLTGKYSDLDNMQDSGQVGITWEISAKSKGTIKGGVVKKSFDSGLLQDYSGSTGSIDIKHEFSSYASLLIVGQRSVNEAKVEGTRYFVTTGALGELSFHVLTKLAVIGRGSYGKDEFSNLLPGNAVIREDRTWTSGGGLKFSIRDWLEIEGDYTHRKRNSNIPANDYNEHSYTLSANAAF